MQFHRTKRHGPRTITARKVSAYQRSCQAKQDRLPLLAPLIAETQLGVDEEMARRQAADLVAEQEQRDRRAGAWRAVRARLFALPPRVRRVVLDAFNRGRWSKEASTLSSLIWRETKHLVVTAEEFPHMSPAQRAEATRSLNDRARAGDTWTRARRAYSPGVMAWLAPGFVPDEDHASPSVYLHTSRGLWSVLWHAVANYDDFSHNTDPSGDRRAGVLDLMGVTFRFEIVYLRPGDDTPIDISFNLDLCKRVVWIGLVDERLDLAAASFESGWSP